MQLAGSAAVELRVSGQERALPPETHSELIKIAQEALTNALVHAHAAHVEVALEFDDDETRLRVEDDGVGFEAPPADSDEAEAGIHFGLVGMRERAERIGARLDLNSEPGRGAEVEVTVPHGTGIRNVNQ
jgi:signal transduction histidine kinase